MKYASYLNPQRHKADQWLPGLTRRENGLLSECLIVLGFPFSMMNVSWNKIKGDSCTTL